MSTTRPRRLGRPPGSGSADTRNRILEVGRRLFAESGYEMTTNKMLAAEVGITAGAIYHYFESKLDIYLAVHADTQTRVYERLVAAAEAAEDTFVDKIIAVLHAAGDLNDEDRSFARFLGAVRVDASRHAELEEVLGHRSTRNQFFSELVDLGVRTGEIAEADRDRVLALTISTVLGLTDVSSEPGTLRATIEAFEALLRGKLIKAKPARRRR